MESIQKSRKAFSKNLLDYLEEVPDFRRGEGKRYPLPALLLMIIMAIMSGRYGYREIARFLKANGKDFVRLFGLKRKAMPSHVTIRTILMNLKFSDLNKFFESWASAHLELPSESWVAIDGKSLASTVSDYDKSCQDFICLVSAFSHQQGTVAGMQRFHNKQKSEIGVAQNLIETLIEALDLKGVIFTFDALHCQKKQ